MKAVGDSFVMIARSWRATSKATTLWLSFMTGLHAVSGKGVAEPNGGSEAEKVGVAE